MKQELKQDEVTQEQPEVASKETTGVTPEAPSTEEKKTSERPRTEEEFRKLQSKMTKAIQEAQSYGASLKSVQSELQELRRKGEQERLEARKREIADLDGDPEGQGKLRRKHQLEDELNLLEEKKRDEEGAVARKYDQAMGLAKEYDLSLTEARELLDATTPKEMELMAQLKAREKEKVQITSTEKTGFKPDSGTSDTGGEDDEAFIKRYAEGKSDDHKRARKILQKI